MVETRQESCTSDDALKMTPKKRYQLGIEKVSLKGLNKTESDNTRKVVRLHFRLSKTIMFRTWNFNGHITVHLKYIIFLMMRMNLEEEYEKHPVTVYCINYS